MKKTIIYTLLFIPALVFSQVVTGLSHWSIYLDPGHSQTENMGAYGYSEAEKNVRVALNVRDLLLTYTDIDTVYLCRTNDQQYVGLTARQTEANNLGVSWYHSIHSDAGGGANANSTLLLWGKYASGSEKIPNGGKAMSDIMIDYLTRAMRTYTVHGSIGDCSFYGCSSGGPYLAVNRNTNMPSELSEAGFHDNPMQNQRNMNAEWKRLESWAFFWSILKYHGLPNVPSHSLTGFIRDVEGGTLVNGATVTLENGMTYTTDTYESLFHKYSTDPDQLHNGFYYLEGIESDSIQMVITADGFYPDTEMVKIDQVFHTYQDIQLVSRKAPVILASEPVEGETAHPAWNPVVLSFSRPMDTLSVHQSLEFSPEIPFSLKWNSNQTSADVKAAFEFLTDYTMTLDSTAADQWGHRLNADGDGNSYVLNFHTAQEDLFVPKLTTFFSEYEDATSTLNPIYTFQFDELLDSASVDSAGMSLVNLSQATVQLPIAWDYTPFDSLSIISVYSIDNLLPGARYKVAIGGGITDLFNNRKKTGISRYVYTVTTDYESITNLEDFEGGIGNFWEPSGSGSTAGIIGDKTTREASAAKAVYNTGSTQSMKLNYAYDMNVNSWLIRLYGGGSSIANTHVSTDQIVQVYIFGDGSGNCFRFCFDDNGGTEVSPWTAIDWYGWKLVSWDLRDGETGTWIGDGTLDGNLAFDSFQFTYTEGAPAEGTMYLDDFRTVTPGSVNSVSSRDQLLPGQAILHGNYPNPFNGTTQISFTLADPMTIRLAVYDVTGRLVKVLRNGLMEAGSWTESLDSATLPSGVYFCRLETPTSVQTKRLTILK